MEKDDASIVVLQKNLESELLEISLQTLIENKSKLAEMSENAKRLAKSDSAKLIVDDILKIMVKDVR